MLVTLSFPLDDGASWTYQGTVTYTVGGQEQTMPPLTFHITLHRLIKKNPAPFEFVFSEENEPIWSTQLAPSPKGLVNPLTGEIWLPSQMKVGRHWSVSVQGSAVKLILRDATQVTVPAGTFSTYQIHFVGPKKDSGSLWLDPQVGIVSITWLSRASGGKSTATLQLVSYNLP